MCRRYGQGLLGAAVFLISSSGSVFAQEIVLDGVVVTSTKTSEAAVDALSGSSSVGKEQIDEQFQPGKVSEVLRTIPGVTTQETARDTATAINIRGLQDFGRVNVMIDGARQNFQRSGHSANGVVYIEPEMIKSIDVTRGPTATIYGSGAIGGVVNFETINADDILRPGEYAAGQTRLSYDSNGNGKLVSETAAVKVGNFDLLGQFNGRWNDDYEDGAGDKIPGSNDETDSKLLKARWRPAAGHEVTASLIDYNSNFEDQVESGGTLYGTDVNNRQYTLGYTFASPTNPLIDFSSKVYFNETSLDQERLTGGDAGYFSTVNQPGGVACGTLPDFAGLTSNLPCFFVPGDFPVGAQRGFDVETEGFDIFNTSRFAAAKDVKVALTYGVDGFRDSVTTFDPAGNGDEFTPSGERTVYGSFVQSKVTFFDIVDLIGAVRYDSYEMDGNGVKVEDEHVSPKVTLGVTPIKGVTVFGTYAEAFRAPALSEAVISGFHPGFAHFEIRPNPGLEPEVSEDVEGGVNLKYDNLLKTGDAFRAKFTAFRNKVDNYIDVVEVEGPIDGIGFGIDPPGPTPFIQFFSIPYFLDDYVQYQNVRKATIDGVEFEAFYDAQSWFAQVGAHRIRGVNEDTGQGLRSVPADQVTLTVGVRALQDKLVAGARTRFVGTQDRFEEGDNAAFKHADAYTVVDLFAQYEVNDKATVNLNVNNVFDETYRQHLDQYNSPGLAARVGLTMRLGAN